MMAIWLGSLNDRVRDIPQFRQLIADPMVSEFSEYHDVLYNIILV